MSYIFSVEPQIQSDPCEPSPCGPHSTCRLSGDSPVCACLIGYKGTPPNCRPECVSNNECDYSLACVNNKCSDPCRGTCGINAECRVVNHSPMCICQVGFIGDAYSQCNPVIVQNEILKPCEPSPCGSNAFCRERGGVGACQCLSGYFGNPYEGCRPECLVNTDCPLNKACSQMKCIDPCPGTCGVNAFCQTNNHMPNCICQAGYSGNPFSHCRILQERKFTCFPSNIYVTYHNYYRNIIFVICSSSSS